MYRRGITRKDTTMVTPTQLKRFAVLRTIPRDKMTTAQKAEYAAIIKALQATPLFPRA